MYVPWLKATVIISQKPAVVFGPLFNDYAAMGVRVHWGAGVTVRINAVDWSKLASPLAASLLLLQLDRGIDPYGLVILCSPSATRRSFYFHCKPSWMPLNEGLC